MKVWSLIIMGGVGVVSGAMSITNPSHNDYEHYAMTEITTYLKQDVCHQTSQQFSGLIQSYCKTIVDTGRPQIHQIISRGTKRHNYLLFSIYQTKLSLPAPIPTYEFETIGVLQNFYTYQADQSSGMDSLY